MNERFYFEGIYQFTGGSSKKYWIVWNYDQSFTTAWGRIGRRPQGKKESLTYTQAAEKAAEKERKGYKKVDWNESDIEALLSGIEISQSKKFDIMAELQNI